MKVQKGHKEGWHDAGKKAAVNIEKVSDYPGSVRGNNPVGPKNASGGGKSKGCGPNFSNDYDTMPSGYRRGK